MDEKLIISKARMRTRAGTQVVLWEDGSVSIEDEAYQETRDPALNHVLLSASDVKDLLRFLLNYF